jgi:K+-transporting ATPase KdpF subunit
MFAVQLIAGVLCIALLAYLFFAMFKPDRF